MTEQDLKVSYSQAWGESDADGIHAWDAALSDGF